MQKFTLKQFTPWLALTLPLGLSACNKYEMFMLAGYEQVSFSSEVDVLFVIDNSDSMSDESTSLLRNFEKFIDTVAGDGGAGTVTESLSDAVGTYISFTADRGRITDYRLAITTTTNTFTDGWTLQPDPGETGLLVGTEPVVEKGDADASHRFKQNLGCWASCWHGYEMESNASYLGTAGDCPFPDSNGDGKVDNNDVATTQYLDCLCVDVAHPEGENWDADELCGSGLEMHLESTLMSLCRSVENPPEVCTHNRSSFEDSWIQTNNEWLRDDSTIVVVYVTDEGDTSETTVDGLLSNGEDDVGVYLDAFDQFDRDIKFAAIGPDLQCENENNCTFECNTGGATTQGVRRLMNIAKETGGFYNGITEGDDCEISDFAKHLNDLGKMLINLQTAFELQSTPDETTIRVYVDDEPIDRAQLDQDTETYNNGWAYEPGQNSVVFFGSAIPDFNQDVRIYYRPLDGKPRDLSF